MSGRKTITYINFLQCIPAPIVALGGMIKVFLFYPLSVRHPTKNSTRNLTETLHTPKLCVRILHTHTTKTKHANHGDVRHGLFCRPWLSASGATLAPRLPMSLAQGSAPGFACTVANSCVWGTKMAPTKNLGDGRSTGLRLPPLVGSTQQSTE